MKPIIERKNRLLADKATPYSDLKELVKELKADLEFGIALKVLERMQEQAGTDDDRLWVRQQQALCTYKDEQAHPSIRLPRALEILRGIGLEDARQSDPETLALGGAVYKRLWEYRGAMEDIHAALHFYQRAWECDRDSGLKKVGYGGVNAAFILDLLAAKAQRALRWVDAEAPEAARFKARARQLRSEMREALGKLTTVSADEKYWLAVTLAEICVGLGDYAGAARHFQDAKAQKAALWELQTTVRQAISIAKLQCAAVPRPALDPMAGVETALTPLLGEHTRRAIHAHRGKVGLALSGGGFRASFFHLGVLARLAEMDALGSVEVLSTVSGGSIVGAHYYLALKALLQRKPDGALGRQDYLDLVLALQEQFLEGVQQNLRIQAIGGFLANLKILLVPNYTRSTRLAELYEQHFYSKAGGQPEDPAAHQMQNLKIAPQGEDAAGFHPAKANWRRTAKVPALLINATTLNSGHNYHFTAGFMGEPPGLTGAKVDMNNRYRRIYYDDIPVERHEHHPLSHAVAASACVPGLFEPLEVREVYEDRQGLAHEVRLVDGGVHDNQGVAGLLDEGCALILCSDASGQMDDQPSPDPRRLGVVLRSNSILQDRVREAQYQELQARVETGSLEGLFFIHLKQDLASSEIDWAGCTDPSEAPQDKRPTEYGIDPDLQRSLARIRTDLDSFTEVEAYALMLSGYQMAHRQFEELAREESCGAAAGSWRGFAAGAPGFAEWPFLGLREVMARAPGQRDEQREDLGRQLDAGASLFFKMWKLSKPLRVATWVALAVAGLAAAGWLTENWDRTAFAGGFRIGTLVLTVGLPLLALAVPAIAWIQRLRRLPRILFDIGLLFAGWVMLALYRGIFDRWFLCRGSLERLLKLPRG